MTYTHGTTDKAEAINRLREQNQAQQQAIRELNENNFILRNLLRENEELQRSIQERLAERERLEAMQRDVWRYKVSPAQRARIDNYKAWRRSHPDKTPTVFGGREGLEAATREIEEFNARKRAAKAIG
jgi:hypothetical protein